MRGSKTVRKLAAEELFEYAVQALGRRPFSTEELRAKLRTRAAVGSDIDAALARLTEIGYLDDKRFAEMYTAMRVENDGFGKARVLHDLRGRRVAPKLAEKAVALAFQEKNEDEMVAAYVERRMPSVVAGGHTGDEKKLAAAYRKLRRAGFASGPILTVLRRFAAHPELLEEPPPDDDPPDA